MASQYGGIAYHSLEELLASDVDAVSVCTANKYHAEISIMALRAGKHVLCEKPMATTQKDCEQMIQVALETGKRLLIGHNQRLSKAHMRAREIVQSGMLGEVLSFSSVFMHSGPEEWTGNKDSWFLRKNISAFGVMADLGVHKTDVIEYITGQKIIRTTTMLSTRDKHLPDGSMIEVDDNACALYELESGATGVMQVSWTNYGSENNATIILLQHGVLKLYSDPSYSLIIERSGALTEKVALDELTSNKNQISGNRTTTGVIDEFINAICTNADSILSGEQVVHAMKVIFANDCSYQEGRTIDVDK